jgi:hypothetical protein
VTTTVLTILRVGDAEAVWPPTPPAAAAPLPLPSSFSTGDCDRNSEAPSSPAKPAANASNSSSSRHDEHDGEAKLIKLKEGRDGRGSQLAGLAGLLKVHRITNWLFSPSFHPSKAAHGRGQPKQKKNHVVTALQCTGGQTGSKEKMPRRLC